MATLWDELREKFTTLAGNWALYSAIGSFALYLVGYLTLRFHLTVLGIGTDLAVLDERYLFAGAKFVVYVVTSIPTVLLLLLVLTAVLSLLYRILPGRIRTKLGAWTLTLRVWCTVPQRLALGGIVLAVLLIQLVMRQCFLLPNVLLARDQHGPAWLWSLLLAETDGPMALYFAALVTGTLVTGGMCWSAWHGPHTPMSRRMVGLLAFLVAIQLLMLPVNYGMLIVDKTMPRVANLGGQGILGKKQRAWLVWEGKDGVTYLLRDTTAGKDERRLVTLPRQDRQRIDIIAYDPILRSLFGTGRRPDARQPEHDRRPQ